MNQKVITRGSIHLDFNGKSPQKTQSRVDCKLNYETSLYLQVTGAYFACENLDHKIKDCPLNKKKESLPLKSSAQVRVYAITEYDSETSELVVKGIMHVYERMQIFV